MQVAEPVPAVKVFPSDRAWFDGRLLTAALKTTMRDVAVPANVPTLVAAPDPARVLLLFTQGTGGLATGTLAPWPDVSNGGLFVFGASLTFARVSLFEYPGWVNVGWYCLSGSLITIRVAQTLRIG